MPSQMSLVSALQLAQAAGIEAGGQPGAGQRLDAATGVVEQQRAVADRRSPWSSGRRAAVILDTAVAVPIPLGRVILQRQQALIAADGSDRSRSDESSRPQVRRSRSGPVPLPAKAWIPKSMCFWNIDQRALAPPPPAPGRVVDRRRPRVGVVSAGIGEDAIAELRWRGRRFHSVRSPAGRPVFR